MEFNRRVDLIIRNFPKILPVSIRSFVLAATDVVTRIKYQFKAHTSVKTAFQIKTRLKIGVVKTSLVETATNVATRVKYRFKHILSVDTHTKATARMKYEVKTTSNVNTSTRLKMIIGIFFKWKDRKNQTWKDVKHLTCKEFVMTEII